MRSRAQMPGPGRNGLMRVPFLGLIAALALGACRWPRQTEAPPLERRITWCGRSASSASDSVPADTAVPAACVHIFHLEFPGSEIPFRVELRRYRKPHWAFCAWQALTAGSRRQDGCARVASRWTFVHGEYLGLTDSSAANLYPEEFKERLAIAGEPVSVLPSEFGAFPLHGRIPDSERLFARDFLGGPWTGPVFSVAYDCHGDTALGFRASTQNPDSLISFIGLWKGQRRDRRSGRGWLFEGADEFGRPIILDTFREGILGISGCYDRELAQDYAEKMRKMQVFWQDP